MKLESREKKGTNLRFISAGTRYTIYPLFIGHEIRREARVFVDDRVKGEKTEASANSKERRNNIPKNLKFLMILGGAQ